ncbi:MAG: hypothetical protein HQ573_04840 [Desulfobacteraceae bacterium]|nr:hypothetical protein [Desulfobacteraceae bacterium]
MAEPGEREHRRYIRAVWTDIFHNVKVPALSLVQKLRRGGEVKSESHLAKPWVYPLLMRIGGMSTKEESYVA